MPRMELTIKTTYVPRWTLAEALREFIQNAKDAEDQFNAPMKIDWYNDKLRIENDGVILPREALLLGHTTKVERGDLRGMWGEGGKLAMLVLARSGYQVKIRSGSEVWNPVIEHSDKFNAEVLVVHIQEGRAQENRVRVEIDNISAEKWLELRERFLFLQKDIRQVKTGYGNLLLDPKYAGKVFVKGIFVQSDPELAYGYDLSNCELDRDRKMVDSYDLKYAIRGIWNETVKSRPDLFKSFLALFDNQKQDIAGIDSYSAQYLDKELLAGAAAAFIERYGENALPVASLAESSELEHFGKMGVVVNKNLLALLQQTMGNFQSVRESLRKETKKQYSYFELNANEKENLTGNLQLIEEVLTTLGRKTDCEVSVVDFQSTELQGLFKDNQVQISRKLVGDRVLSLRVLIHEYAHALGGSDGEKQHVSNIEMLWAGVAKKLMEKNNG